MPDFAEKPRGWIKEERATAAASHPEVEGAREKQLCYTNFGGCPSRACKIFHVRGRVSYAHFHREIGARFNIKIIAWKVQVLAFLLLFFSYKQRYQADSCTYARALRNINRRAMQLDPRNMQQFILIDRCTLVATNRTEFHGSVESCDIVRQVEILSRGLACA